MRYYDHRHLILPAGVVEKLEYGFARLIVQSAGRFITQKQLRILSERSRYRDSLLLTAGELCREVRQPVRQPHLSQDFGRVERIFRELRSQLDIFKSGQILDKIVELEHEAYFEPAVFGQFPFVVGGDFLSVEKDGS